jgi:tRNA G46 methylase TrmB
LNLLAKKLKIGSVCHMATDWQDYAQQMMEMLEKYIITISYR